VLSTTRLALPSGRSRNQPVQNPLFSPYFPRLRPKTVSGNKKVGLAEDESKQFLAYRAPLWSGFFEAIENAETSNRSVRLLDAIPDRWELLPPKTYMPEGLFAVTSDFNLMGRRPKEK
jgi:hypothetical protein